MLRVLVRALFCLGVVASVGRAQAPCEHALTGSDLKDLLGKKVGEGMIRQLVTTCGLTMTVDDAAERDLKRLGATDTLIALVRERATSATRSELELRAEIEYWSSIKESTEAAPFEDYLNRYPTGRFVVPAQAKLRSITTPASVVPAVAPISTAPGPSVPVSTSIPSPPVLAPSTYHVRYMAVTTVFGKMIKDLGTLVVNNDGLSFRPDQPDGHSIAIHTKDLDSIENAGDGIKVNHTIYFDGLKTPGQAEALFDAVYDVMNAAGKFTGSDTAHRVTHWHGLVKGCRGTLTVSNNDLHFASDDHQLTWNRSEHEFVLHHTMPPYWDIDILDKNTGKKIASLNIQDWDNPPLRSLWGKPTRRDKKGFLHWN